MATFSFAEGAAMFDSTPIENLFLLEYLPKAPDTFLRVYLYARVLALHPELGGSMEDMARALRLEETVVYNAFSFWEQQGLVRRLTDRPPTYELLPVRGENDGAGRLAEQTYYTYRDFNTDLQALFKTQTIEAHEYRIVADWLNVLGYDQAAVLRLVQYGIETCKTPDKPSKPYSIFKRLNKLAIKWADEGCRTLEDVEAAVASQQDADKVAKKVLERFNQRREPSLEELDCVKRWTEEWGYTPEQIVEACAETTKATKPTFAYLNGVLENRLNGGNANWQPLSEALRELDALQAVPTPELLKRYAELMEEGFEAETVKLAAIQCHNKKRTRFEDVENMLDRWAGLGLYAAKDARAYIEDMSRKAEPVRRILERCGLERRPTLNDLALYEKWQAGHDGAVIDFAAECARGTHRPMAYMDKLLDEWAASGVRTAEAARAAHEANRAARSAGPAGKPAANPALDYAQRKYTDADYGDDFFFDVVKEYGKGDAQK